MVSVNLADTGIFTETFAMDDSLVSGLCDQGLHGVVGIAADTFHGHFARDKHEGSDMDGIDCRVLLEMADNGIDLRESIEGADRRIVIAQILEDIIQRAVDRVAGMVRAVTDKDNSFIAGRFG